MAATLALATCGPQLEVALATPDAAAPSVVRLGGVSRRSALVLAAVDLLVEDAGLRPADLTALVVSRGPGSFTGIRSGLATAAGIARATGATITAYDSLAAQAARVGLAGEVWAAQPGRRGEVYAQAFRVAPEACPEPLGAVVVLALGALPADRPWVALEGLELGPARRALTTVTTGEALLRLHRCGAPGQPVEPLYVEGPPTPPEPR